MIKSLQHSRLHKPLDFFSSTLYQGHSVISISSNIDHHWVWVFLTNEANCWSYFQFMSSHIKSRLSGKCTHISKFSLIFCSLFCLELDQELFNLSQNHVTNDNTNVYMWVANKTFKLDCVCRSLIHNGSTYRCKHLTICLPIELCYSIYLLKYTLIINCFPFIFPLLYN